MRTKISAVAIATVLMLASVATSFAQTATLYPTRSGYKSVDQLSFELTQAGYPGPWDIDSMLAAYGRAAAPPIAPPAPAPVTLDPVLGANCFEWATNAVAVIAPYMSAKADFGTILQGLRDGCTSAARQDGWVGVNCYENDLAQWLSQEVVLGNMNAGYIDSYYRACMGR